MSGLPTEKLKRCFIEFPLPFKRLLEAINQHKPILAKNPADQLVMELLAETLQAEGVITPSQTPSGYEICGDLKLPCEADLSHKEALDMLSNLIRDVRLSQSQEFTFFAKAQFGIFDAFTIGDLS